MRQELRVGVLVIKVIMEEVILQIQLQRVQHLILDLDQLLHFYLRIQNGRLQFHQQRVIQELLV
jgi:hypothetical protein